MDCIRWTPALQAEFMGCLLCGCAVSQDDSGGHCLPTREHRRMLRSAALARFAHFCPFFAPPAFRPVPAVIIVPVSTPKAKKAKYIKAAGCVVSCFRSGGRVKL